MSGIAICSISAATDTVSCTILSWLAATAGNARKSQQKHTLVDSRNPPPRLNFDLPSSLYVQLLDKDTDRKKNVDI